MTNDIGKLAARDRARGATLGTRLGSLVWRLLTAYGRLKYRYLLPLYAMLGLERRDASRPSRTLRGAQRLVSLLRRSGPRVYREQLAAVRERLRERKGAVIFLPSTGWHISSAQRHHHLARELARQGWISIFDCSNQYDDVDGLREIESDLLLYRGPSALLAEIPDPVLWSFTYNFHERDAYPRSCRVVYDWIDDLEVFPFDRDFLERNHARAMREAAVVTSVARRLHEQALELRRDAIYLPNGVEYQRFAEAPIAPLDDPVVAELCAGGRPLAGYYGSLARWLDYELLDQVAALRPDWSFLLIGQALDASPHDRGRSLLARRNVRWIGHREYAVLPAYLQAFDVATIPFVIDDVTRATSPLKLYEYFAGGKPVVATPMPECEAFAEVHIAADAEQFAAALDAARARGTDARFRERLRALGRSSSWTARVRALEPHLSKGAPSIAARPADPQPSP